MIGPASKETVELGETMVRKRIEEICTAETMEIPIHNELSGAFIGRQAVGLHELQAMCDGCQIRVKNQVQPCPLKGSHHVVPTKRPIP